MFAYIVRRLLWSVVLLFVLSVVVFSIFYLIPLVGGATPETLATRYVGRAATPETVHLTAERLGLLDPVPVQYWHWVKGVFVGAEYDYGAGVEHCPAPCLGYSFITRQPVWPELLDRAPVTISLVIGASLIWLVAGVSVGVISALRRGSVFDRGAMGVALGGVSLPIFFTGLIALAFFSYKLRITAPGGTFVPFRDNPAMWAYSLLLPWITLAFLFAAQYARLTRAGMLDTMTEDYIRTARAKGLPERTVVLKHGLRGALTPVLTIFGLDVGLLLGGAVITEKTFSLNGLGKYAYDGIISNDLPKILGVTLVAGFFVIIANLIVDLLYGVIDPRVRLE
jgi:peptide/nickel transport system permease protein